MKEVAAQKGKQADYSDAEVGSIVKIVDIQNQL